MLLLQLELLKKKRVRDRGYLAVSEAPTISQTRGGGLGAGGCPRSAGE